jgi:hypothetical protein
MKSLACEVQKAKWLRLWRQGFRAFLGTLFVCAKPLAKTQEFVKLGK